MARNVAQGVRDAVVDAARGAYELVTQPQKTVQTLKEVAAHPIETGRAIKEAFQQTWQEFQHGDANTKGYMIGRVVPEVMLSVWGAKGADKLGKLKKAEEAAETAAEGAKQAGKAETGRPVGLTSEVSGSGSSKARGNLDPMPDHLIIVRNILPMKGNPNSSMDRIDEKGKLIQRRYYDEYGRAIRDIDYTNHGNPKEHPEVPHEHFWDYSNPTKPIRR